VGGAGEVDGWTGLPFGYNAGGGGAAFAAGDPAPPAMFSSREAGRGGGRLLVMPLDPLAADRTEGPGPPLTDMAWNGLRMLLGPGPGAGAGG